MRKNILGTLAGALLLAGCGGLGVGSSAGEGGSAGNGGSGSNGGGGGGSKLGQDLSACSEPKLADMSLATELDGIEIRVLCQFGSEAAEARIEHTYGASCSSSTCKDAVAASDAGPLGWREQIQLTCDYHVVGMLGDELVTNASNNAELERLFGSIDTVAEAQVVAAVNHLGCQGVGERDGALHVLGSAMIALCPIRMQEVLYRIDADASVHEIERGAIREDGACVGRRPAGLAERDEASTGNVMGDYFARSAELEAASVVAFQILEAELALHGAEADLVQRSRAAAEDEIVHARLMQRLAERFGGEVQARSVRVGAPRDLEAIALENAVEGCVAETWGCLLGMHQALHAEPGLRIAYQRIAADEARHAQLSWDIAAWAESQLDEAAVARIAAHRARAVAALAQRLAVGSEPSDAERALGLPDSAARRRLFGELEATLWS